MEENWVQVREYSSRIEADLDLGLLEEAGIPVQVKGPSAGIYGPGFAGPTPVGFRVFVREEDLEDAISTIGLPSAEENGEQE
jgi:hypothetical protein